MITVKDVKAIAPEAEIIALDPNSRYLIICRRQTVTHGTAEGLAKHLASVGIRATVLSTFDPASDIRILEIQEEQNGR
jgi:hypothetical protein